ncbi:hypothetical protein QUF76_01850 [Desulfobacterales bacterium HSG16]|nr:hypothetical protein [Desulfobacterales bacterium HSG16]
MMIKPKYVVDELDHKVAVQIDIETFDKIEEILENYALYKLMENDDDNEILNLEDAKKYYRNISGDI